MKTLAVVLSATVLAVAGMSSAAEARPGRGHAYGHFKPHRGHAYGHYKQRYVVPYRGYYAAPRYRYRRSGARAAIAAGVTGAIIGGVVGATTPPTYRYYPSYRYHDAPYGYDRAPRRYYREEYYGY